MYLFQFWHERWLKVCLKINNKQFEEYKLAFVRLFVVDAYIKKKKKKRNHISTLIDNTNNDYNKKYLKSITRVICGWIVRCDY